MLFIVNWNARPENRNAVIDRFLKTGGKPPEGTKMLGRWHTVGPVSGFALAEASDASALEKWVLDWSDLMSMDVHPAVTDEQMGPVLASKAAKA